MATNTSPPPYLRCVGITFGRVNEGPTRVGGGTSFYRGKGGQAVGGGIFGEAKLLWGGQTPEKLQAAKFFFFSAVCYVGGDLGRRGSRSGGYLVHDGPKNFSVFQGKRKKGPRIFV